MEDDILETLARGYGANDTRPGQIEDLIARARREIEQLRGVAGAARNFAEGWLFSQLCEHPDCAQIQAEADRLAERARRALP